MKDSNKNKIYFINNHSVDSTLTIGKWYGIIVETERHYYINHDKGYESGFYKSRFLSPEDTKKQLVKERFKQL